MPTIVPNASFPEAVLKCSPNSSPLGPLSVPATPFARVAHFLLTGAIAIRFLKRRERLKFYKLLQGDWAKPANVEKQNRSN